MPESYSREGLQAVFDTLKKSWLESFERELRERVGLRLEDEIRPLIGEYREDGGYNCCGCNTYDEILDHAIRIVRGTDA